PGEASAHVGVLFELRERDERADAKSLLAVALDAVEAAYAFQIHNARGACDVVLHSRQQVLPARDGSRVVVNVFRRGRGLQETHCLADARRTRPLERLHTLCPPFIRPVRILSGVIGNSRTRTPAEGKAAHACRQVSDLPPPATTPFANVISSGFAPPSSGATFSATARRALTAASLTDGESDADVVEPPEEFAAPRRESPM